MAEFYGIDPEVFLKKVKSEWDRSPDIRAEHNFDFDCYLAYRKAVEAGVTT